MYLEYTAYGLRIRSVIPIPEFVELNTTDMVSTAEILGDVSIRLDPDIAYRDTLSSAERTVVAVNDSAVTLFWSQVGTFQIQAGCEILIAPERDVDPATLRLFLLGPAFGILLHQRGWATLHGSAVSIDRLGCIFLGGSGWGKSTLCAALDARGHHILTDDIAAITFSPYERPLVMAAFPRLKIWPDSAEAMGHEPTQLGRLRPEREKRALTPKNFENVAIPLHRIYVLARSTMLSIEPLSPATAILECVVHAFSGRVLEHVNQEHHFSQYGRLAREIPIKRLMRPWDLMEIPRVVHAIEADVVTAVDLATA